MAQPMKALDIPMDTKLLEEPPKELLVDPSETPLTKPKLYKKTHRRRKFTPTIFDRCPKDIQHMLFNYCVNAMLADPKMPIIKKSWKNSFQYGRFRKHIEHYISFSHRLLRALAQTCRSLHVKVVEYRKMIQNKFLIDHPGRNSEFLRIEKERTIQSSRHTKAVVVTTKKNKSYWVKKQVLKQKLV